MAESEWSWLDAASGDSILSLEISVIPVQSLLSDAQFDGAIRRVVINNFPPAGVNLQALLYEAINTLVRNRE